MGELATQEDFQWSWAGLREGLQVDSTELDRAFGHIVYPGFYQLSDYYLGQVAAMLRELSDVGTQIRIERVVSEPAGLRVAFRSGGCRTQEELERAFGVMQKHGFNVGLELIERD